MTNRAVRLPRRRALPRTKPGRRPPVGAGATWRCGVRQRLSLPPPVRNSVARPASRRATGTRNGEQDT